MIITEKLGENCVKTYSSVGKNIKQNESGAIMQSAIDVFPNPYTYVETDEETPQEEVDDSEALSILLGGAV